MQFTPEQYADIFKKLGVDMVIRLNEKLYDANRFVRSGIKHKDFYFLDGSCPSELLLKSFLEVCEEHFQSGLGGIAIHCKAGLGRTGTLIGCYAMKHFKFPAEEFIGWSRICRPGSVLGPQQHFLIKMQGKLFKQG